jgi:hypothetical protein
MCQDTDDDRNSIFGASEWVDKTTADKVMSWWNCLAATKWSYKKCFVSIKNGSRHIRW